MAENYDDIETATLLNQSAELVDESRRLLRRIEDALARGAERRPPGDGRSRP